MTMDDFVTNDAVVENAVVVAAVVRDVVKDLGCSRGSPGFQRHRGALGWSYKLLWTMELQSIPP